MASPADIASFREHFDVIVTLLFLSLSALIACALYIFNTINKNAANALVVVERHTKEIARVYTCLGKICTAHNINHNQDLEC